MLKLSKVCNLCKKEKLANEYYNNSAVYHGMSAYCKPCFDEYNKKNVKKYREKNRAKAVETAMEWAANNRERSNKIKREWAARNKKKKVKKPVVPPGDFNPDI